MQAEEGDPVGAWEQWLLRDGSWVKNSEKKKGEAKQQQKIKNLVKQTFSLLSMGIHQGLWS